MSHNQSHSQHNNDDTESTPRVNVDQVIDEVPAGSKITGLTADGDSRGVSVSQVIAYVGPGSEIIGFDGSRRD